jgi:phosphoribosylamine--glycine ligase
MRFLGVGDTADLAALYLRLVADGHDVKVFVGHSLCQDTLAGLIDRVTDWQAELGWVRAAGTDGCILFENVGAGRGELQDHLRRDGFNVIGSSAYGARLENDRAYAQRTLRDLGFSTANTVEFSDVRAATQFIDQHPARYVLKSNGAEAPSFVGSHSAGRDVQAVLEADGKFVGSSFVLMDFIDGIEMGVGVSPDRKPYR